MKENNLVEKTVSEEPTQTAEQGRILLDDEKLDQVAGGAWVTTDSGPRASNTNGGII